MNKLQKIRIELKEKLNLTNRKISVKNRYASYDEVIEVTIKDLTINIKDIENVVNKYEKIRRCKASYEILSGGNTYINVKYDYELLQCESIKYNDVAKILIEKNSNVENTNNCNVIYEDDNNIILYSHIDNNFRITLNKIEEYSYIEKDTQKEIFYKSYNEKIYAMYGAKNMHNVSEFIAKIINIYNIDKIKLLKEITKNIK